MYTGYITNITNVRKHPNADRLQIGECFGNTVVVDLSVVENQVGLFFPIDGQLDEEFARKNNLLRIKNEDGTYSGGYLDPEKRNIKAVRLRGEKSEGIFMDLSVLSDYVDITTLTVGEPICVLNGVLLCQKYVPKRNHATHSHNNKGKPNKSEPAIDYPLFDEHADTEQLMYNLDKFHEGDIVTLTLKCHGTSGRTAHTLQEIKKSRRWYHKLLHIQPKVKSKYTYISGTRRCVLENYEGGYYSNNKFRQKWHDFFVGKLPQNMTVYYEIVGYLDSGVPIMGSVENKKIQDKEFVKQYGNITEFSYGCEVGESDMYVYRITLTSPDGYVVEVPWSVTQKICERMGAKCVPTFETFIYTTAEDLLERVHKYYDGADPIGKTHIREGVVARIENREKFTAFKVKNFSFKCLAGIITDSVSDTSAIEPDILAEM